MAQPNYRQLIEQLVSPNPAQKVAAKMILIAMEESAVHGLADEYYAGITDPEGVAILEVIAEIGGYDAMNMLRSIYTYEDMRPELKRAAANGLLKNAQNLSQDEREEVALFIAGLG